MNAVHNNIKDVIKNIAGIFSFPIRELPEELIDLEKDIIYGDYMTLKNDKINMRNDYLRLKHDFHNSTKHYKDKYLNGKTVTVE